MATSGTTTFSVNRDEIITGALRLCGVLQDGQSAGTQQVTDAAQSLNLLLKYYATKGWLLWCYKWVEVPLVASQEVYTLGVTPADVVGDRPVRIARAWVRNLTTSFDTPIIMLSRQAYDMTTPKDMSGIPNSFYYDPQVTSGSTAVGRANLYVWPVPVDSNYSLFLTVQRPIQDITGASQQFDVPQEWFLPLKWQLASEIGPEYGVTERQQQRIDAKAEYYLKEVCDFDVAEEDGVTFAPNTQLGMQN